MARFKIEITRDALRQTCRLGRVRVIAINEQAGAADKVIFECDELCNSKTGLKSGEDLALPSGRYKLEYFLSPKFSSTLQKDILKVDFNTPLICIYNDKSDGNTSDDVDKTRRILIHWGNTEKDTIGCELLGYGRSSEGITNSRNACGDFYRFMYEIAPLDKTQIENVELEIIDNLEA